MGFFVEQTFPNTKTSPTTFGQEGSSLNHDVRCLSTRWLYAPFAVRVNPRQKEGIKTTRPLLGEGSFFLEKSRHNFWAGRCGLFGANSPKFSHGS